MKKNRIGPNNPCPCGSGKKYKKCCKYNKTPMVFKGIDDINLKNFLDEKTKELGDGTYSFGTETKTNIITSDNIVILKDGFNIDLVSFKKKNELIRKISSYDLESTDITIIKKDFDQLREGEYKTCIPLLPEKLYRVRKNSIAESGSIIIFSNINELKYPPENLVKDMGRLNNIGESIFYASPNCNVAINECYINNNDFFTLSEYEFKDKDNPIYFSLRGIDRKFYKSNFPRSNNHYANECLLDELKTIEDNGIQKFLFDEFTKRVFSNETFKYKTTIALASIDFTINNTGIVYPSIANNFKGTNIALPPKVFDDNLIATNCRLCKKEILL